MASGVAVYAVSFSPVSCPSTWRDKTWCLIFSPLERWDSPCHPSSHFQTATPTSDHRTKNVCRGEAGQKNRTGSVWSACTPALSTRHPKRKTEKACSERCLPGSLSAGQCCSLVKSCYVFKGSKTQTRSVGMNAVPVSCHL